MCREALDGEARLRRTIEAMCLFSDSASRSALLAPA
jgi:hypothetical protein